MKAAGRAALVVLVSVVALAAGYATARSLTSPDPKTVPVIDLDEPPTDESPVPTAPPSTDVTVVPPPTVVATAPPPPQVPGGGDDDGDHDGEDGDD